jgi:hypothetical protein
MDPVLRYYALPGAQARRTDTAPLLGKVGAQAAFHRLAARHLAALYAAPVPCTAVTVACFREDGALLTWRRGRDQPWDLPACALAPGADAAQYAAHVLTDLGGIAPAERLQVFGLVDWGPAARAAGWGWTACLFGQVGAVDPLPRPAQVSGRAFLPVARIPPGLPADPWPRLRGALLQAATELFAAARDFWLLQTLDALIMYDLDDVPD